MILHGRRGDYGAIIGLVLIICTNSTLVYYQKSSLKFDFNELFYIFFRFKPAQEVHNLRRVLFYLLTYLIG